MGFLYSLNVDMKGKFKMLNSKYQQFILFVFDFNILLNIITNDYIKVCFSFLVEKLITLMIDYKSRFKILN